MKHRLAFAAKKLLRMGLLLLGVSLVTFLLMCASPLDPLQTNVGQTALGSMSPEQVEKLEAYWGADTPAAERYLGWLGDVLHGDFGTSLLYRQPVIEVIGERLAGSVWLMLSAWVISGVLGVTLGVISGAFRGRWADRLIRGYCLLISGTPAFWLAILLLLVFSVWLGWLPVGLAVPVGMTAAPDIVLHVPGQHLVERDVPFLHLLGKLMHVPQIGAHRVGRGLLFSCQIALIVLQQIRHTQNSLIPDCGPSRKSQHKAGRSPHQHRNCSRLYGRSGV